MMLGKPEGFPTKLQPSLFLQLISQICGFPHKVLIINQDCNKIFINSQTILLNMTTEISIPVEEYTMLKKKAEIADNIILQLDSSVKDLKAGKLKKV